VIGYMSLFSNEDILTTEIESWKSFVANLSSSEDRKLFENMLNDCYKYAAAINAQGEPLLMALLLSQHKVINRLTELISKQKSLDSNNKEVKESKEGEQELGREINMIT